MQGRNFRERVTGSSLTLPVMIVVTALLWLLPYALQPFAATRDALPPAGDRGLWGGFLFTCLTAYGLAEWNNRAALLRIRSRLISCSFLLLCGVCPFLHAWTTDMVPALCLLGADFLLFQSYQKARCEGEVFHAFLLIGIGSLFFWPLLLMVPLLYLSMAIQLRTLTPRTFLASLLGLMAPYWAGMALAVWDNRLDSATAAFVGTLHFARPDPGLLSTPQLAALAFTAFTGGIAMLHTLRTAFNDKIRTRLCFYAITLQFLLLLAATILQPQWFGALFRLLLVATAPLSGHYWALARGRFMNAWFILILLCTGALAVFNSL